MRVLDISFPEPERNLALDEALLNRAEAGQTGDADLPRHARYLTEFLQPAHDRLDGGRP